MSADNENQEFSENQQAVDELRQAWKELADSLKVQPTVYDIDDVTGEQKVVWLGEWISGPDAPEKADAISRAKMEEFERIGPEAFRDTLPLENVLKPGECRFV